MIDLYIPCYKRPNAILLKRLAEAEIPFTIVLDHKSDAEGYEYLRSQKTKILMLEHSLGIGYVRQKIKERYRGIPIMMMDDDTQLRLRDFYDPTKLPSAKSPEQIRKWFAVVDRFCQQNKFDIGSVSESAFRYKDTEKTMRKGSYCSVTIFNSPRCAEVDYDPNLYSRMEDWDLLMQAITKKFDFLICNEVLRFCPMNKDAKSAGGCSEVYQNDAEMLRTTNYLMNKWKGYVTLNKKKKIGNVADFRVNLSAFRAKHGYDY